MILWIFRPQSKFLKFHVDFSSVDENIYMWVSVKDS